MSDVNLYEGNCLEVMQKFSDNSVDMVLCDLPFNMLKLKWDVKLNLEDLWVQYRRIVKTHGAIVLFAAQPFTTDLIVSNRKGYKHKYVWDKHESGNFAVAKYMPLNITEDILVFTGVGERVRYFPQMVTGKLRRKGSSNSLKNGLGFGGLGSVETYNNQYFPKDLLDFESVPRTHRKHPSEKPVKLLEYLLKTYSLENDVVLDNTMGSGSTIEACINLNRSAIGIELDSEYFNVAHERKQLTLMRHQEKLLFERVMYENIY